MGRIYRGSCSLCGYEKRLFLEGGLMSVNLEASALVLPEEEQNILKEMREGQEIVRFHVENYLVECLQCQEIMGKTIIEVIDKSDKRHIFGEHCGSCKKKLKIYRKNAEAEPKCPKCQKGTILFEEEGLWD